MKAFYEIDSESLDETELDVRITATLYEWREACEWLETLVTHKDVDVSMNAHGRRMLTLLSASYKEVRKRAMGGFDVEMEHGGVNADTRIHHMEDKSKGEFP